MEYPIARRFTVYTNLSHGQYNRLRGIHQIPKDSHSVGEQLFLGEPVLMNDFHLFDDGRFAGLA